MQIENVRFKGFKPSRSTARYVELQVKKWIESRQATAASCNDIVYDVEIEGAPRERIFECLIWIRFGLTQWLGQEVGETLQSSVEYTLRRMRNVIVPFGCLNSTPVPGNEPAHFIEAAS